MSETRASLEAALAGSVLQNRRAYVRHPCDLDTACHPIAFQREMQWSGRVLNVSLGGVGLVINRRFEVGTLLAVELQCGSQAPSLTLLARVVHTKPGGAGSWVAGCSFLNPLSEDEVQAILAAAAPVPEPEAEQDPEEEL
jgi:hypothetical protein